MFTHEHTLQQNNVENSVMIIVRAKQTMSTPAQAQTSRQQRSRELKQDICYWRHSEPYRKTEWKGNFNHTAFLLLTPRGLIDQFTAFLHILIQNHKRRK